MNRTKIEWVKNPDGSQGYTWNPITGCLNHVNGMCKGGNFPCYAYRLAEGRLRKRYLANKNTATRDYDEDSYPFYPRFWPEKFDQVMERKVPTGWFHCDMSDWLGIGVPEDWSRQVYQVCVDTPWHRHYLLTKQAHKLPLLSPYPPQCWVGVTVTSNGSMTKALTALASIEAGVKFLSIEPHLGHIGMNDHMSLKDAGVGWVIDGSCTGTRKDMEALCQRNPALTLMPFGNRWTAQPRIEWVQEIVEAADRAGVKVFLKDNLAPLWKDDLFYPEWAMAKEGFTLRQEMPQGG